jgi:exopolysaccharide production protein ExoY
MKVRPGLTGLWQIRGRSDVSYQNRIKMDVEYIENMNMLTDIGIIIRTVPAVLRTKGSY